MSLSDALKSRIALVILIIAAAIVRFHYAILSGHGGDLSLFTHWADSSARSSLHSIYADTGANYPPFYLILLWLSGEARATFPFLLNPEFKYLSIKFFPCMIDILTGTVLYIISAKAKNYWLGVILAGLYFFNPAVISDSAIWGQTDGVVAILPLLACYCLQVGAWRYIGLLSVLALCTKFQTLPLLFVVNVFFLYDLGWKRLLLSFSYAFPLLLVIIIPFINWGDTSSSVLAQLELIFRKAYSENIGLYPYISDEVLNFWGIINPVFFLDNIPIVHILGIPLNNKLIGLTLFCFSSAILIAVGIANKDFKTRTFALGMVAWSFFMFPSQIHERYLLPALAFFTISATSSPLAMLILALSSFIHLESCYPGPPSVAGLKQLIPLPAFFVSLYWFCQNARRLINTRLHINFLLRHIHLFQLLLVCITFLAVLTASGFWFRYIDNISLLDYYSVANSNKDGVTRIDAFSFANSSQTKTNALVFAKNGLYTFYLAPNFPIMRARIQLHDPISPATCQGQFTVVQNGVIISQLGNLISDAAPIEFETTLPRQGFDRPTQLQFENGNCSQNAVLKVENPLLISSRALLKQGATKIYLSDIANQDLFNTKMSINKWQNDRSIRGAALAIKQKSYLKGIAVHADAIRTFPVPTGFKYFITDIGYDSSVTELSAEVSIAILLDNEEIFRLPKLKPGEIIEELKLPVKNAKYLTISVDSLELEDHDMINFGNARFER